MRTGLREWFSHRTSNESTPMSGATNLIFIGTLVGVLVVGRRMALRRVDPSDLPCYIARRIEVGNHVAPWVGAAAVTVVFVGLLLSI